MDWRCGAAAALGIADRALDLDGVVGGVFCRGGGLHRWRLPSGSIFGEDGDGGISGLGGRRRVIGDAEWLPGEERIS